ncbi:UNVERIFIED_CONTAM: hypothetical protein FKN15_018721 [Acipenser sinensis]
MDQKKAETGAPSGSAAAAAPTCKRKQSQVAKCNDNKTLDVFAGCGKAVCGKCSRKMEKRVLCVDCTGCLELRLTIGQQTPPPPGAHRNNTDRNIKSHRSITDPSRSRRLIQAEHLDKHSRNAKDALRCATEKFLCETY